MILSTGGVPGPGGSAPGGAWSGGAWSQGGQAWSGGVPGGDPLQDGYCCGLYASYWNAFLS